MRVKRGRAWRAGPQPQRAATPGSRRWRRGYSRAQNWPAAPRRVSSARRSSMAVYVGMTKTSSPGDVPGEDGVHERGRCGEGGGGGQPAYLRRRARSSARSPAAQEAATRPASELVVDVPDPAHVLAVGEAVVEQGGDAERRRLRRGDGGEQAEHLVRAGRVLAEDQAERARPSSVIASWRPNAGAGVGEPGDDRPAGRPRTRARAIGGEGVVDVVGAGERHR